MSISRHTVGNEASGALHPRAFAPATFVLVLALSVLGAIIGLQLLVTLGVTPNTSLVGALVAIALARVPLGVFRRYRSIHVQNLAQSAISAATFGAANSLLLPIGVPWILGRPDLILPMFAGVACAMLLDAYLLYRMFGTSVFPADAAWPPGIAAGEAIRAGDEGGRKAGILGLGLGVGVAGGWAGIPMSAFGIAFVGNVAALTMFGIGLLVRGYSKALFSGPMFQTVFPDGDVGHALLPHGFMIGAGLMALIQVGIAILHRQRGSAVIAEADRRARRTLGAGFVGYICIAILIAALGGLFADLPPGMLLAFVLYAAFAAFVHELIVGLAAMHSGWFPAFAVALITLMIGIMVGFPVPALALLVGFSAATGPAFADMGYDLKAGFLLRGNGVDPAFEAAGRWQQLLAAMTAFVVAMDEFGVTIEPIRYRAALDRRSREGVRLVKQSTGAAASLRRGTEAAMAERATRTGASRRDVIKVSMAAAAAMLPAKIAGAQQSAIPRNRTMIRIGINSRMAGGNRDSS